MIQAVIFDCFGVLTADTWRAFVDSLPPEADVQRARELNRQYDGGFISLDEFLEGVAEATGQQPRLVEKMLDNEVTKNSLLLEYISNLRPRYKIGLLSNVGTGWIRDSFLTEAERGLFDTMVFSFEVGMTKPDRQIFELACDRLDVALNEAVLVDDVKPYVEQARSYGMQGVVYTDFKQFKADLEHILSHP